MTRQGRLSWAVAAAVTLALAGTTGISYAHGLGDTTLDHTLTGAPGEGFVDIVQGPPSPRLVRTLGAAAPRPNRDRRRRSLAYFAQLTDFQLADEESPARVEFLDRDPSGTASAAWRPQEAFQPQVIDWSFRQLDSFTAASPVAQGGGKRAPMDFGLLTGDQSDNQQLNETLWVRQLVEGGQPLDPNSGKGSFEGTTCTPVDQAALMAKYPDLDAEAARYTGVQDYDDLPFDAHDFYDPDEPAGEWADNGWPTYPGVMDRAQQPFVPVGLRRGSAPVPTYVTNGNHDGLVQGNEDAIKAYEDLAIGCFKPFATTTNFPTPGGDGPNPNPLLTTATGFFVPPDDRRQFVDRPQLKRIYQGGIQADGHGFDFVDPAELAASTGAATYYAWDPKPGLRFVSIDTVSEGGVVGESDDGNVDDPQWHWLEAQLDAAERAGKLIVVFGHHPIRSLTANVPDEAASPCTTDDSHGHDVNPGCDLDPRPSTPVHLGDDLVRLLSSHPAVVAYVAGHTHENEIRPCGRTPAEGGCPADGNWWEINTSATADWPQQHRLIELMDNRDGTLSIFATALDHGAKESIPPSGSSSFSDEDLASMGRNFSWNDPQSQRFTGSEGGVEDRNVELLVKDPRG